MDEVPLSVLPAVATELEEDDGARGEVRDGVSRGDLHTSPRRYLASGDRTGRNARPRCLQQCEDSVEAQGRGVRVEIYFNCSRNIQSCDSKGRRCFYTSIFIGNNTIHSGLWCNKCKSG